LSKEKGRNGLEGRGVLLLSLVLKGGVVVGRNSLGDARGGGEMRIKSVIAQWKFWGKTSPSSPFRIHDIVGKEEGGYYNN